MNIFVSHSSKDKSLVDALVNILLDLGCGINRNDIYYSSMEDMKTWPGNPNFIHDLQKNMKEAKLIILMLSPNYYDSQYCLAELGATWMLDTEIFPIVVPPFKFGDVKGILQVTQLGELSSRSHLDKLRDTAIRVCNASHSTANWNEQRLNFTDQLDGIIKSLPQPTTVSREDLDRALGDGIIYKQQRDEAREKIIRLTQLVETLKDAKDADEVSAIILESLPEHEQFEALRQAIRTSFGSRIVPRAIIDALYYDIKGEELVISPFESTEDADNCVDDGYLIRLEEEAAYSPNQRDKTIAKMQEALQHLNAFLKSTSDNFREAFEDKHDYEPELANKRFWSDFLW